VRAAQARLDELQRQLAQMRGGDSPAGGNMDGFPSIRAMPLLGVKYANLYRNLEVETAVYESLTKQYEMAKVEEARDLPTVRVLDVPDIPEKKSRPQRTLLVVSATVFATLLACCFILAQGWWRTNNSPWKLFAAEAASDAFRDISRVPGIGRLTQLLRNSSRT